MTAPRPPPPPPRVRRARWPGLAAARGAARWEEGMTMISRPSCAAGKEEAAVRGAPDPRALCCSAGAPKKKRGDGVARRPARTPQRPSGAGLRRWGGLYHAASPGLTTPRLAPNATGLGGAGKKPTHASMKSGTPTAACVGTYQTMRVALQSQRGWWHQRGSVWRSAWAQGS